MVVATRLSVIKVRGAADVTRFCAQAHLGLVLL